MSAGVEVSLSAFMSLGTAPPFAASSGRKPCPAHSIVVTGEERAMAKVTRRVFTTMMGAAGISAQLPGIARAAEKELVVVSWGGRLDEPFRRAGDKLGVKVLLVPGQGAEVIAKVKASQGTSPYDTFGNDEPALFESINDGLIVKLDPSKFPNLANVRPEFLEASHGYGVPVTFTTIGIAYNTELVKTPPQAWKDLWNPEHKGLIGVARPSSNLGLGMLAIVARLYGGSDANLDPAFDKLKELNPTVARTPALLGQLLERREVGMAVLWHTNTAVAASKGIPVKFVKPAPGSVRIVSVHAMIIRGPNPDLAVEFLDSTLTHDYQEFAAKAPYYFGSTIKDFTPPPEAAEYVPGPNEPTLAVDWKVIVPKRTAIVEKWDRMFSA
jgi:putative spermidine/putrescine transport system substrate-binding protein